MSDATTREGPWPFDKAPVAGDYFKFESNETVKIDRVTDDYVYLSNGKKLHR